MIVTLLEIKDFLGEGETSSDDTITSMILSAEEEVETSTGITLSTTPMQETAKRAIRIMVWLSFYADRDSSKNAEYLIAERTRLLVKLKWGGGTVATT